MPVPVTMTVTVTVTVIGAGLFLAHGTHNGAENPPQHLDNSGGGAGANVPHLPAPGTLPGSVPGTVPRAVPGTRPRTASEPDLCPGVPASGERAAGSSGVRRARTDLPQ